METVNAKTPFFQTPWSAACNWYYWNDQTPLEVPNVDGFLYTHGKHTPTGQPRLDLDQYRAWYAKRIWGYVADIWEGNSENTATPYELTIIGRIPFMEDEL